MKRYVVDTNLLAIAKGAQPNVLPTCKFAVVTLLSNILKSGSIVVDDAGEILREYKLHCNPAGQPNVGDEFFRQVLLNYGGKRVLRTKLQKNENGEYVDFPSDPRLNGFDLSDRKFAAASIVSVAPVYSATDSDWLDYLSALSENGVMIELVCTTDRKNWFQVLASD